MFASLVMLSMKYDMVHAATVQAFNIGTLLTTLPITGQHGFDMAFTVSDTNTHSVHMYTHYTRHKWLPSLSQQSAVRYATCYKLTQRLKTLTSYGKIVTVIITVNFQYISEYKSNPNNTEWYKLTALSTCRDFIICSSISSNLYSTCITTKQTTNECSYHHSQNCTCENTKT